MNIYTIYRATNTVNGKVYIGFDSSWPKRKGEHKNAVKYGDNLKFYNAIRKHGWNSFQWDILYQSLDYEHCLNVMEPFFIAEHDSLANGYNGNRGGGTGSSGAHWWNNGVSQIHTQTPPDQSYKRGRLKFNNTGARLGAAVNAQKHWINDGKINKMIFKNDPIPAGWVKGRIKCFGEIHGAHSKGSKWWNNGINSTMSHTCPGEDYVPGRIKTKSI